jgi:hypothetical protein
MAEIGIFNDEKKKWIQFDSDTEVLIKHIDRQGLNKLRRKAQKAANISDVDATEYFNLRLGREAVHGWRKINDHSHPGLTLQGRPLEFNRENLDMLMSRSLDFSNFVNENAIDAKIFLEEQQELEAEKNG